MDVTTNISKGNFLKCYNPQNIEDYVIVSDARSGKLYRNKHCALCNGIKEYVNLKLQVNCKDKISMLNLEYIEERDLYFFKHCSLLSFPPERQFGISQCVPASSIISKCNSTGNWDFYDKEIEKGCTSVRRSQMVYRKRMDNSKTYTYFANVFCFLCNKANRTEKTDICDKEENEIKTKSGIISYFAILYDAKLLETKTEELKCDSTHIWDPYKQICRHLLCPPAHRLIYGSCEAMFNIYGYTLDMHFEVIMMGATVPTDLFLLRMLERRLENELGDGLEYGKCKAGLYTGIPCNSKICFRYMIFSNEKCAFDQLLHMIRRIVVKKEIRLKFRLQNNQAATRIALNFIFEDARELYNKLVVSNYAFCRNSNRLDASIYKYCPSIIISDSEVYALNIGKLAFSMSHQLNGTVSDAVQVCVDDYFAAKQAKSSAVTVVTGYCRYCSLKLLSSIGVALAYASLFG